MKQGSGNSRMGDMKPMTQVNAISPRGVSQIGSSIGNHVMDRGHVVKSGVEPVHIGRGFTAPALSSCPTHKSGSQGRHD
jgi:hypothetical protein